MWGPSGQVDVGVQFQERRGRFQDFRHRKIRMQRLRGHILRHLPLTYPLKGRFMMADMESAHLRLQQQIDCQLEVTPSTALKAWEREGWKDEPGTDVDEAPLKYMALVLLDAIEDRASRVALDKDEGVTVFSDATHELPKPPTHILARGLEILREISGLQGPKGEATLALGIRNDSLDLVIHKEAGKHMINFPGIAK
jgi:hypothetical protein